MSKFQYLSLIWYNFLIGILKESGKISHFFAMDTNPVKTMCQ